MRSTPGGPAVGVPRVVLDARAGADLAHHLDVVGRAHPQPLRLEQLAGPLKLAEPLGQLGLDLTDRALHLLRSRHVVRRGADVELGLLAEHLTRHRVQRHQPLDLVSEELHPHGELLVHREHLEGVAADPEGAAGPGQVVARVLHADQLAEQSVTVGVLADLHMDHPVQVLVGRPETVDARHGGDDDHVPAGQQRPGRRVPEPLDLLVDRGVLLDVGVGLRDVRLGLVVVVVRHEVLDGVVREELAQLVRELCGEGLVRLQHQDRSLDPLGQPRNRGGLAGAGRAQQDDVLLAGVDPPLQLVDRRRLVTGRLELRDHLQWRNRPPEVARPVSCPPPYGAAPTAEADTGSRLPAVSVRGCRALSRSSAARRGTWP